MLCTVVDRGFEQPQTTNQGTVEAVLLPSRNQVKHSQRHFTNKISGKTSYHGMMMSGQGEG